MFGLHTTGRHSPALPAAPQPQRPMTALIAKFGGVDPAENPASDQFVRSLSDTSLSKKSVSSEEILKGQELLNAAAQGDKDLVYDLVVNQKVDANHKDISGWSALMQAARGGNLHMLTTLLWGKADVDAQDKDGTSALMTAVKGGSIPAVRKLLKAEPNQELEDRDGYTALQHAVRGDEFEIASLLLDAGADPNHSDRQGNSLSSIAIANNNRHMFEGLVAAGADYQPVLKYLEEESDSKEASEIATLMLNVGINVLTPEDLAAVLDKKPDLQVGDAEGVTPLMRAANKGDEEKVRLLLEHGADPTIADNDGKYPYAYAVKRKRKENPVADMIKAAVLRMYPQDPTNSQNEQEVSP